MATTTRTVLRANLAPFVGFYFSSSATGAGTSTTVVDTEATQWDTSRLRNKWLYMITAVNTSIQGTARRIASVSGSTITVDSAFAAATSSGDTYQILEWQPNVYHDALVRAIRNLAGFFHLSIRDETLVVDNLIANFDFETFAGGAFTSWVSIGSPTLTQNTSYFVHGSNAANIAGVADVGIEQNLLTVANGFGRIDQAAGKTLRVRGWLRATDASNLRLRVTFDGSTYTNGAYHSGDDDWEGPGVHKIDVAIPVNATEMTVSVEKSTGVAAQADMVVGWIDPISVYTVPTAFHPFGPHRLFQQDDETEPNGLYHVVGVDKRFTAGRILRLEGEGRLTAPTTDAGTVELDAVQSEVIVAQAAEYMFSTLQHVVPERTEQFQRDEVKWGVIVREKKFEAGQRTPRQSAHLRHFWEVSDSSGTRSLILQR